MAETGQLSQKPYPYSPYVGPRSFDVGESNVFFGRERELQRLTDRLIAARVVLLHAPSGAGKTSLIQTGLIPRLRIEDFTVLPTIRLGYEPPSGLAGANRFVLSMLLCLEEGQSMDANLPLDQLASMSLAHYLGQRLSTSETSDVVLIIDQLEEVLTIDPADRPASAQFFAQLGEALRDKRIWALLAIRDEYVGALAPYLSLLPEQLNTRLRIDLLSVEGARSALVGPARSAGVDFNDAAAAMLIDDLRRMRIQRPDGSFEEVLGPTVEPVQLQVVGLRLWRRLFGQTETAVSTITEADVQLVGDVNSVLSDFYNEQVARVAQATGVQERSIRNWFEVRLMTADRLRNQVLRESVESAGLSNQVIAQLIDAYLVRAEQRRGATWYELAHDRMIAPIVQSNSIWRERALSVFQRQAALWAEQGRPDGLLLRGAALEEAEQWVSANPEALTREESEFLTRAHREDQSSMDISRRFRLLLTIIALLALMLVVMIVIVMTGRG